MKKFKLSKKTKYMASSEQAPKRFFSKKAIWSIIIAAIMALSIIGYISIDSASPQQGVKYNGFALKPQGNPQTGVISGWTASIDDREINFYNHPTDLLSINVSQDITTLLRQARVLIITSPPNDTLKDTIGLMAYEFQQILEPSGVVLLVAFTENNTFNKPIMTCANATAYEPIVFIAKAEENRESRITTSDMNTNCIVVEGRTANDLLRMRDRLLYAYYSIIS